MLDRRGLVRPDTAAALDARGELARHIGHRALPTTLFFDARGVLAEVRIGEVSQATLAERLSRLGASPAPGPKAP